VRGTALRWIAVLAVGVALLAVVLYFASTVDGRPPQVAEVRLTQALSTDARVAVTTSSVEVVFSEPVDHRQAEAAFGIEPDVDGAFSWSGSVMVFTPVDPLPLETEFTINVGSGVSDEAGNVMPDPAPAFSFRTVGPPRVIGVDPPDRSTDIGLEAVLEVTFSTLMDTASTEGAVSMRPEVPLAFTWRREVLEVAPLEPLQPDRAYELVVSTEATDQAGTPLEEESTTSFTTVAAGLSVERLVPADGTQGISVGTSVWIEVDGEIDPESLDESLTITPDVPGTLEVVAPDGAAGMEDATARILRFTPSGPLPPTTTFEVQVQAGLRSIDGRILARELSWSFTTGAPQPTLANQVLFLSDRSGVANLWAMNPDGSNERQVSSEMSPVTSYAAAPDGRSFVVGDGARLVASEASGGGRRILTDAGLLEFDPAFAPDGRSLIFGRADRASGSGLGIWRRDGFGGGAERLDLPEDQAQGSPTPDPSLGPPVPLLRSPAYAPDGETMSWVDEAGAIVMLDLESGDLRRTPFNALEPPAWLPDGRGLVTSGTLVSADAPPPLQPPGRPIAPLDEQLIGASIADLQIVRLPADGGRVVPLSIGTDAARVAVGAAGRISFVRLSEAGRAGTLWLSDERLDAATQLIEGDDRIARAAFAPDPRTLVVERVAADGAPAGLWLLDESSGQLSRLSDDGRRPLLLP
jgi:hypothetical protein